ncbi:hypothetical protein [Arthrobacter sp. H14]|uniref:hypothetical protein n=1 Tax=Arthrobacter sp. H14 TaxID=1312959 RepID=UPI0020A69CA7|nr:hypothetical protein [Arthrobacter sp. H14]
MLPPALTALLGEDLVADVPIQLDQFSIDRPLRPNTRLADPTLEHIESLSVPVRKNNIS